MLPVRLLEQLVASRGVATPPPESEPDSERRSYPSYTLNMPVTLHRVEWRIVLPGSMVTLRDISRSGVALVLPDGNAAIRETASGTSGSEEWVVWFGPEPRTTFRSVVLLCQTVRRSREADGSWVLGGRIEAVLAPRNTLTAGVALHTMEWVPMLDESGSPVPEGVGPEGA